MDFNKIKTKVVKFLNLDRVRPEAWNDWLPSIGVFLFACVMLSALFVSCEAKAEYIFPEGPVVFIGIDIAKNNIFCEKLYKEDINGKFGIRQSIWKTKNISANGTFLHNSCAFRLDRNPQNSIGLEFEYRSEGNWPVVFVGIDVVKNNAFCEKNEDINGKFGIRQSIWKKRNVNINGTFLNNSCAFRLDENTQNSIGFELEYIIGRKR